MKKRLWDAVRDTALTAGVLGASTLVGFLFQRWELHETNVVVLYIFSVLLISRFTKGYLFGILTSAVSVLLFNWFFTEPFHTLKVHDMTYLITFAIMMFASVVTGTLTSKVKQAAKYAVEREKVSNALYRMTNGLTDAEDAETIARITVSTVGAVLGCDAALICFDEQGAPEKSFIQWNRDGRTVRRELENGAELQKRMEMLHGASDITEEDCCYPVYGKNGILAVLRIPGGIGAELKTEETRVLHSVIESTALALGRMRSIQEQTRSREEALRERYRSNLLRSISHDIRTPLSGIMGAGEILMDTTEPDDPRYSLAEGIYQDAQWLHGMVENILNLTRLRDGGLALDKQSEPMEEVVGAALGVMEKRSPGRIIDVVMPEDLVMVEMDAKLISQVLINLLDNADKHTGPEGDISVSVWEGEAEVTVTVADSGSGIPEQDLPHIFGMFYTARGNSPDSRRGVGLGLAICQSIVEAHGGTIRGENRSEGGAAFTFTLPLGGEH